MAALSEWSQCRTPTDALEMQARYASEAMADYVAEGQRMWTLMTAAGLARRRSRESSRRPAAAQSAAAARLGAMMDMRVKAGSGWPDGRGGRDDAAGNACASRARVTSAPQGRGTAGAARGARSVVPARFVRVDGVRGNHGPLAQCGGGALQHRAVADGAGRRPTGTGRRTWRSRRASGCSSPRRRSRSRCGLATT